MTSFGVNLPYNICFSLLIVNFVLFLKVPYYIYRISRFQERALHNDKHDYYASRIEDIVWWMQGSFILSVCLFILEIYS
jgi:hypothetical protein